MTTTDDDDAEATDDEEEAESGPDPIIAAQRFGAVSDQMEITRKALKKHGRGNKQAIAELLALAELFMPIKLVPKQFEGLVERVRSALDRLRQQERAIMQLCVRDARMPRADFLRQFPGNEVDESWTDALAKGKSKYAEAIGRLQTGHHSLPAEADRAGNRNRFDDCRDQGHQPSHVDR